MKKWLGQETRQNINARYISSAKQEQLASIDLFTQAVVLLSLLNSHSILFQFSLNSYTIFIQFLYVAAAPYFPIEEKKFGLLLLPEVHRRPGEGDLG